MQLELVEVCSGREALLRAGGGRTLWPGALAVERLAGGGLDLVFAELVTEPTLYAVRFRTQVFLGHTQFRAHLLHADFPTRLQEISAGEATTLVASQSLVAVVDLKERQLLEDVAVVPAIFTPNGDGINDRAAIEAKIFAIEGSKRLRVVVFDLAGRLRRDLSAAQPRPSGIHYFAWDGRDDAGRLVPPGVYAVGLELAIDAERGGTTALRLVHVAY